MDVDGSSVSGEIDQNLLLQFSCMNTTDREELINQMQILLGPSLTYNTANFFLDMSNWNLQAAICCYLDYTLPPKLPSVTITAIQNQETPLSPGASFQQAWTIANTGAEAWPPSCRLVQMGGEPLGAHPVYLPPLPPGESTNVVLNLTAPSAAGTYRGYFHITYKGDQIGETLWVGITVESEMTMALVEQLAALPVPSSRNEEFGPQQAPSQDDQMC